MDEGENTGKTAQFLLEQDIEIVTFQMSLLNNFTIFFLKTPNQNPFYERL